MMKKNIKLVFVAIAGVCLVATGYLVVMNKQNPAMDFPTLASRGGNANASTEFLNAQKAVDFYREEIRQHPERVKYYIGLAQLFLQEARVTGRHHEYLPTAQYLIGQALDREPQNYDARVTKATMLMTMHKFEEAEQLVQGAIDAQPHTATGYGVLCDAQVELGKYDEAVRTCDKMMSTRPDLRSYARASYLRELHGDPEGAIQAMKMAADAGVAGQENRAWALYNLGKLFLNQGKLDTAAYIFNGILEERPGYAYALSGLAQVKRAQGRIVEGVDLLSKASQLTPEHVFVEQLADLYSSAAKNEQADGIAKIAIEMFSQHEKAGWNINREYAMFCADHGMNLEDALQRAAKEYQARPDNIDVLETYAWTLYRNGKAIEAASFIERALRLNTKSYMLAYHAAKIYEAAGQSDKAAKYYNLAKNRNRFVDALVIGEGKSHNGDRHTGAAIQ
jgi:tetratricopeptide (TPR) repeat protein